MLNTNKDKVIKISVQGKVHHASGSDYIITQKGEPVVLPHTGGIVYNVKVGDTVYGFAGDHIEPGVSVYNEKSNESDVLNTLSCIGNEAIVVSGDAKGHKGIVTGKHGGVEHVIVDFKDKTLDLLAVDDKILIKAYGQGLELLDYKDIKVMCIDPSMLLDMKIEENGDGTITVPVVAKVPPYLMGSGIGAKSSYRGDYDIMTADKDALVKNKLDRLKFGDFVLLEDCDNVYGRGYLKGAVSIGVVIHGDCVLAGHGPGIVTILVSQKPLIKGKIVENANIKEYFK